VKVVLQYIILQYIVMQRDYSGDRYYLRAPVGATLALHEKSLRWQAFLESFSRAIALL
jgi:hypothetical protein